MNRKRVARTHTLACYYKGGELHAIRDRQYKLVFPHKYRSLNGRSGTNDGKPIPYDQNKAEYALYDLKSDVSESVNVVDKFPQVVERLSKLADEVRSDLGDKLTRTKATGVRPAEKL